jgi:excinuclease ABC subunit C
MTAREQAAALPLLPGVYFFLDAQGTVLYVGKAKSLRKRVASYFSRRLDAKTQALVARIVSVRHRVTLSEAQAQILEASLVKELQPQYNLALKDDKSFPWVRITRERFPIVSVVRRNKREDPSPAEYFGPYTDAASLRKAMLTMRRIFGFRTCRAMPSKACLYHRLRLCPAPCEGSIPEKEYGEIIGRVRLFLQGKYIELIASLTAQMQRAAREHRYEAAAQYRDQVQALSVVSGESEGEVYLGEAQRLQDLLGLPKPCERIEAFDISNMRGREATGSMVSFWQGKPDKANYRRFRIRTVAGIDDYAMMREVVRRRYTRVLAEGAALPDLVLIDGGKGHLEAALGVLKGLGVEVALMSIAKEDENIYVAGRPRPFRFREGDAGLNLIRRVRDEAHRFAVAYHHILHRKRVIGR